MKITYFQYIAVFLPLLFFMAGCNGETTVQIEPSGKTVTIGVVGPFSEEDKLWTANAYSGADLARQIKPYLLNGDRIELVKVDDGNDPKRTVDVARQLSARKDVSALLVFSESRSVLALAGQGDDLQIPVLAVISTHPKVTENRWISQLLFDDEMQGLISALFVLDELLVENVTVFKDLLNPHSVFLADEFARKFNDSGGSVRVVELGSGERDYEKMLSELEANQASFMYLPIYAKDVIGIEKASRVLGLNPQMMVSDGVAGQVMVAYQDDVALLNGMLATDVYSTKVSRTSFGKEVVRRYKKNFNEPGTTFAALGCEGLAYLMECIEKCGNSNDRECVSQKIRSGEDFTSYFGNIRIGEDGKAERPVFINLIKKGNMENLVKIY